MQDLLKVDKDSKGTSSGGAAAGHDAPSLVGAGDVTLAPNLSDQTLDEAGRAAFAPSADQTRIEPYAPDEAVAPSAPAASASDATANTAPVDQTLAPPAEVAPTAWDTLPPPGQSVTSPGGREPRATDHHHPNATLLDAHLPSVTEGPQTQPIAGLNDAPSTALIGSRTVGPRRQKGAVPEAPGGYEILGELGRGGMGVVYKARQPGLNRLVALKMVLAAGRASADEVARFRSEAEAAARLDHPNIVRVYQVGDHNGSARILLDLARAVACAHRGGILHRDLKPANVLIAAPEGVDPTAPSLDRCIPKITDFGLAKRLEGDAGQTRDGSIMGTPSYMSPEQAQGKVRELGPPADVYSLGAILYDLLTGSPPFRGETVMDTLQQVIARDPMPPSRLQTKVPPDLSTICLKCLEKDPRRRYPTADALAEDLRRFLDGEPIQARPTPALERGLKWARRRPTAAALAVVSVLALLAVIAGGYAYATVEARRARESDQLRRAADAKRRLAEEHFRLACSAVDELLARVGHERLAHEPRLEKVRQELLQQAVRFYERFLSERADDPEVRWQAARTRKNLGDIRQMLGRPDEAEREYHQAIDLLAAEVEQDPDKAAYRQDLAATRHNLGLLLAEEQRHGEAEEQLTAARALRRELADGAADDLDTARDLAASAHELGVLLARRGAAVEAEAAFGESLGTLARLSDDADLSRRAKAQRERARAFSSLAKLQQETGRDADAAQSLAVSRDVLNGLAAAAPGVPEYRQELAEVHNDLGRLWRDTDPNAAEAEYREALRLAESLASDFPATPAYRQDVASTLNNLGVLLQARGRRADAEAAFAQGVSLKRRLADDVPWAPDYRRDLAAALNNRGLQYMLAGQLAEAEGALAEGLSFLRTLAEKYPTSVDYRREQARTLSNQAALRHAEGKIREGEALLTEARNIQETLVRERPDTPQLEAELGRIQLNLGALLKAEGLAVYPTAKEEARTLLTRAEEADRSAYKVFQGLSGRFPIVPDYRHQWAGAASNLAGLLEVLGRLSEAKPLWDEASKLLAELAARLPAAPVYLADRGRTLSEWARALAEAKDWSEAKRLWGEAEKVQQDLVKRWADEPMYRQDLARTYGYLGNVGLKTNHLEEAADCYRKAIQSLDGLKSPAAETTGYQQDLIGRETSLTSLLAVTGPPNELETERRRLIALRTKFAAAHPKDAKPQADLAVVEYDLGVQLFTANRAAEARTVLESAARHSRAAGAGQSLMAALAALGEVLLGMDDYNGAAKSFVELLERAPAKWEPRVQVAALLARCSAAAAKDEKLTEADRKAVAREHADKALAALQRAASEGVTNGKTIKKNADFAPLKDRPEFRELLQKLGD
jgi:tetratricopeptide (TPR) repeat protein